MYCVVCIFLLSQLRSHGTNGQAVLSMKNLEEKNPVAKWRATIGGSAWLCCTHLWRYYATFKRPGDGIPENTSDGWTVLHGVVNQQRNALLAIGRSPTWTNAPGSRTFLQIECDESGIINREHSGCLCTILR